MKRKKIIFIVSRFPYPLDKGDKLRAYHQLRFLSQHHDIYLMALHMAPVTAEARKELEPYCKEIHTFQLQFFTLAWQVILSIFHQIPMQVGYFYSPSIRKKMHRLFKTISPDTIYCQLSRTALYAHDVTTRHVIDYQDAFSTNYQRIQMQYRGLKRWFYAREGRLMKQFEIKMAEWYDACTIISEFDKQQLQHTQHDITVVPNGVDIDYFTRTSSTPTYDLVFSGNLSYIPNQQAALFIIQELLPTLKKNKPDLKVLIAGTSPGSLQQLADENLHIPGWMPDIRTAYQSARIFIAPLFSGAGMQNKILEAMSMKVPCITTSIVNASINANVGQELLIANSSTEFIDTITSLLHDNSLQQQLAQNGRLFIEQKFRWDMANQSLLSIL